MDKTKVDLDRKRLLGFAAREDAAGAMVSTKNPPPDDDSDTGDNIQGSVTRVMSDPRAADAVGLALAERVREEIGEVDLVAGAAVGGVVVGFELARHLGVPFVTVERSEGGCALRDGLAIGPGARCVVVDDTFVTGRSMLDSIAVVQAAGGQVVGAGCVLRRVWEDANELAVPMIALAEDQETFESSFMQDAV